MLNYFLDVLLHDPRRVDQLRVVALEDNPSTDLKKAINRIVSLIHELKLEQTNSDEDRRQLLRRAVLTLEEQPNASEAERAAVGSLKLACR